MNRVPYWYDNFSTKRRRFETFQDRLMTRVYLVFKYNKCRRDMKAVEWEIPSYHSDMLPLMWIDTQIMKYTQKGIKIMKWHAFNNIIFWQILRLVTEIEKNEYPNYTLSVIPEIIISNGKIEIELFKCEHCSMKIIIWILRIYEMNYYIWNG